MKSKTRKVNAPRRDTTVEEGKQNQTCYILISIIQFPCIRPPRNNYEVDQDGDAGANDSRPRYHRRRPRRRPDDQIENNDENGVSQEKRPYRRRSNRQKGQRSPNKNADSQQGTEQEQVG